MMDDFVINDEQPMRGTLIDAIRVIREYINRPPEPENTLIGTKTGTIITADDAFSAIPKGAKAYGKSTQDGTPTPETPVPIMSVDDLTLNIVGKNLLPIPDGSISGSGNSVRNAFNAATAELTFVDGHQYTVSMDISADSTTGYFRLQYLYADGTTTLSSWFSSSTSNMSLTSTAGKSVESLSLVSYNNSAPISLYNIQLEIGSTATAYAPYVGQSIPIPLSNHVGRSLPDGTRDTLTLSYIGPAQTEGWGVFSKTLVQRVWHVDDVSTLIVNRFNTDNNYITFVSPETGVDTTSSPTINVLCPNYPGTRTFNKPCCYVTNNGIKILFGNDDFADRATAEAMLSGVSFDYQLATPITHDLGTVELPILPAPNFTFFANGGNAQPDVQISYERDITIVIDKLEAAETPVGTLGISPAINHSFEPSIQTQEETEWQSDSI